MDNWTIRRWSNGRFLKLHKHFNIRTHQKEFLDLIELMEFDFDGAIVKEAPIGTARLRRPLSGLNGRAIPNRDRTF
jgi:hypothetical protein